MRLDSRAALLGGDESGPAIVASEPDKRRLVKAIGYADSALQMPSKAKLSDAEIATLTAWGKTGAPWPEAAAPSDGRLWHGISTTTPSPVGGVERCRISRV